MSRKSAKIAALIESCRGGVHDAHYHAYFECFNRGWYFEAHDVLEALWLPIRRASGGDFFKGLIQLAGAFVHLQKGRLRPAEALFRLAQANLEKFPASHLDLDLACVLALISGWRAQLTAGDFARNPLEHGAPPQLSLSPRAA